MGRSAEKRDIHHALIIDSHGDPFSPPVIPNIPFTIKPPILVQTVNDALSLIHDPGLSFGAICLSPVLTFPGSFAMIRMAHQNRPGAPIYVLQDRDEEPPFTEVELTRLAVQGLIAREDLEFSFGSRIKPLPLETAAWGTPGIPSLTSGNERFIPVPVQNFFFESTIFFDVFVQVRTGLFLKILEAGNSLPTERLQNYLRKNVTHFYFKSAHHQRCVDYCKAIEGNIHLRGLSPNVRIAQVLNQAHEALESVRTGQPLTERQIEPVTDFIQAIHHLIRGLDLDRNEDIAAIFRNLRLYEHSISTALTACLLARKLGITDLIALDNLGMGAFLHDIGLQRLPPNVQSEDMRRMSSVEKKLYFNHPILGAEILQASEWIHPSVIQAVAQHHERHNGNGFPRKTRGESLCPLAEIIGIADEFARATQTHSDISSRQLISLLGPSLKTWFSERTFTALVALFDR